MVEPAVRQEIITSCTLTSSCLNDFSDIVYTYCYDNNIFGGGRSWAVFFGWGEESPSQCCFRSITIIFMYEQRVFGGKLIL